MGRVLTEATILYDSTDSMERNNKEKEYLDYIIEHINFVKKAYKMYMMPLLEKMVVSTLISDEELKAAIIKVGLNIDTHDASKFSDSEFDPYRAKYYPTQRELNGGDDYSRLVDESYEEAWKHHYTVNAHHPMHWVNPDTGVIEDMTLDAIVEMICDWEAMSIKFNTSTVDWYKTKAIDEKKAMSDKSKEITEELLFNILHNC